MKRNYLRLVIVFLLALALGAHAESGSGSSPSSGSSSGSGSNSGGGSGGGSYKLGSANITPGNVTPPTPAKNSDRQTQSKAAAAAARAGAGMQRVMCFKMMNDARKQSDSTDKAIMMMMANQACQQASQTEQNADKNDQAAKALSADDIPKQGTLTAGKFQLDPQSSEEPTIPVDSATAASSGDGGGSNVDLTLPTAEPFDPSLVAIKTPTKAPIPEATTVAKTPEDPTSPLKPIPPAEVAYDENAKKEGMTFGQASTFAAAIGAGGTYAGARPVGEGEGNKTKGSIEESGKLAGLTGKERAIASVSDAGGAGGGGPSGGGDGEKSGGDSALDAMLAQMMGGGAGGELGPMPGQDVLVLPEKDPSSGGGTKLPNIFEFANWRFQKAAFEEGRVRTRAPKVPTLTDTAKVARASKR